MVAASASWSGRKIFESGEGTGLEAGSVEKRGQECEEAVVVAVGGKANRGYMADRSLCWRDAIASAAEREGCGVGVCWE